MNKSIEQVKEFHETFSHPIGDISKVEPLATRQLRIKLLFEELEELAEASDVQKTFFELCHGYTEGCDTTLDVDGDNVNQIEELDALCDIQYVLNGKILTAGMQEIFDKNFDLVHHNNMSKLMDREAAELTYASLSYPGSISPKGNGFIVTNLDGKIIKPHNHVKVLLTLK